MFYFEQLLWASTPAAPPKRKHSSGRAYLVCVISHWLLLSVAAGSIPTNPSPLLIELHPPFNAPYTALTTIADGSLIVGAAEKIGIFDGLSWRVIKTPTPAALTYYKGRIWIGSGEEIGWIEPSSANPTYHIAVRNLPSIVARLASTHDRLIAVSLNQVLLLDLEGHILDKFNLPRPSLRWWFQWKSGWVILSMTDAFYIEGRDKLSVSDKPPLNAEIITEKGIGGSVEYESGTYLLGRDTFYRFTKTSPTPVAEEAYANVCRHLISALTIPSENTFIRFAGEGLDGFNLSTGAHEWQAKVGDEIIGNLGQYPTQSQFGAFFGTASQLYWIPSAVNIRSLISHRQTALGIENGTNGFWVCTSDGSWFLRNGSWSAEAGFPEATFSAAETSMGVVRGQIPMAVVGQHREILPKGTGQIKVIRETPDGLLLVQPNSISTWGHDLKLRQRVDSNDNYTSAVVLPSGNILIGTSRSGARLWIPGHNITTMQFRSGKACHVECANGMPVVAWSDGVVFIGDQRVTLPCEKNIIWSSVSSQNNRIIIGGSWESSAALAIIEQVSGVWRAAPLDNPALRATGPAWWLGMTDNRVGIVGPQGALDIAISQFDRHPCPKPSLSSERFVSSANKSVRFIASDAPQFTLQPFENEIRFTPKGGPAYWKQRVKFAYRLLPDSTDWTDLDPAQEVDIQRIAVGNHTLEIESRSIAGTATSRYTIIRPPYWYASHWAFGAYGLSLMGATAGFFVWRTRRLRVRARVLEERVAQRTAELKKANEAKDEFLASMSHEIRNPLNGVIGLSGMLQESVQTERDRRLIESLRACADQLRLVLDDVLDFSVIERGDVQLQLAPFNPAAAIRAAVVAVDAKLERTHVTFGPKLADGLWLRGDEGKLRQIVSNLVSNAHKYGVPPEAKVDARLHDGRLIVTVSNTGPDIPPDDQARIFESFERGRSAAHKYVRGAGLGLTISSRFARAMGGEITVKSENGLTSFAASIPAPVVEKPAHTMAASAAPSRGVALAIEDEPYNRLVLGHVLSGLGFEVEWAQNGTDALDILKSGRPYAMIFTDWMLPDMQGSELVRQIKQLRGEATPPMVAVTAYATAEKRAEAFDAGVAAFVTKPITPEKIEGAVQANAASDAPSPSIAQDEPLRVGILLDGNDAAERVTSFRTELLQHMAEIETALRQHDSDRTARTAHRLASQLLAIHHHTFADELRALETAALRYQWDLVRDLYANATRAATSLSRQLETLAHSRGTKPASDRP